MLCTLDECIQYLLLPAIYPIYRDFPYTTITTWINFYHVDTLELVNRLYRTERRLLYFTLNAGIHKLDIEYVRELIISCDLVATELTTEGYRRPTVRGRNSVGVAQDSSSRPSTAVEGTTNLSRYRRSLDNGTEYRKTVNCVPANLENWLDHTITSRLFEGNGEAYFDCCKKLEDMLTILRSGLNYKNTETLKASTSGVSELETQSHMFYYFDMPVYF